MSLGRGVELGHKASGIAVRVCSEISARGGGEITTTGLARKVGISRGIHGQCIAIVRAIATVGSAAEVRAVDKGRSVSGDN